MGLNLLAASHCTQRRRSGGRSGNALAESALRTGSAVPVWSWDGHDGPIEWNDCLDGYKAGAYTISASGSTRVFAVSDARFYGRWRDWLSCTALNAPAIRIWNDIAYRTTLIDPAQIAVVKLVWFSDERGTFGPQTSAALYTALSDCRAVWMEAMTDLAVEMTEEARGDAAVERFLLREVGRIYDAFTAAFKHAADDGFVSFI